MIKQKILHLSLKKEAFEVMVTGEKSEEFRKPSKWILSRLYDKSGKPKEYDVIKFTQGYGAHRPHFVCKFEGVAPWSADETYRYSTGFTVKVVPEDIIIRCGAIGIVRNYNTNQISL